MRRFRSLDKLWSLLSFAGVVMHCTYVDFLYYDMEHTNPFLDNLITEMPDLVKVRHAIWSIVRE